MQYGQRVLSRTPWSPGSIRRFPWLGLGALIGSLVALGACVGILVASNGQPISSWKVQPSVYLAIAVPVVNLLISFALAEGVDVAWWKKASSSGTTVGDLHRFWDYGKSFKSAILAGRHINLVGIACILAVVAQINSPLLQRASRVIQAEHSSDTTVTLQSSLDLPDTYYSGYTSGRQVAATLYSTPYSPVVAGWNANTSYSIPSDHGCSGVCKTRMRGLGMSINCTTSSRIFNLTQQFLPNGTYDVTQDPSVTGTDIFYADIGWIRGDSQVLSLDTLYKDTHACSGSLSGQSCLLSTATVEYNVVINGPANTITLDPATTIWDDDVLNLTTDIETTNAGLHPFAGYYLALLNRYNSSVHMRWVGALGYEILSTGSPATLYAELDTTNGLDYTASWNCSLAFSNPMDDIIAGARDLMFRTSLAIPQYNSSFGTSQTLQAEQVESRAVFHSNYAYLAGAVAITLVAMVVTMCVFRGYSEFGRPASLSPIAVAKAFDAPLLRSNDSNQPVDKLIKEVGGRSVRYGAVHADSHDHSAARLTTGYKEGMQQVNLHEIDNGLRLCMADEDVVALPCEGQTFIG